MKKTFKILSTVAITALTLTTTGCTDWLTIYPTDKVVLEEFWKNKEDVNGMVANSYKNMVTSDFINKVLAYGEFRSDDVIETSNIKTDLKYINNANLLPTNPYCDWSIFYKIINNCNIVLKFAPDVIHEDPDFQPGDLNVVRGEMLAIRALCHFYLVRAFRDIPLLQEAMVDDSQPLYKPQVGPLEALDFILQDLQEAENLVLDSGSYADMAYNKGRITKDAVRAMMADALLWKAAFTQYKNQSDGSDCVTLYTEAIEKCEKVIADRKQYIKEYNKKLQSNGGTVEEEKVGLNPIVASYPLETNPVTQGMGSYHDEAYYQIFGWGNNLKESIFELQFDLNYNPNYAFASFYGYEAKQTSMPFMAATFMGKTGSEENLYKATDLRRVSSTFMNEGEEDVYHIAKYTTTYTSQGTTQKVGLPNFVTTNTDNNGDHYTAQHYIVYRVTDVMLMEAEARALRHDSIANDLNEAFKLVKAVYYRSNPYKVSRNDSISYAAGDPLSMQSLVMAERQRELCFEGKRWFDLVRMALRDGSTNGMLNLMVPHKYESNQSAIKSKMASMDALFFPIHENVIKIDSLIQQNPAYITEDVYSKN